MLRAERLEAGYGDVPIIHGISLEVAEGEIVALIGSNGAGKTTLLKTLAGLLPATGGQVRFEGQSITSLDAYRRVRLGISLVPEGRRMFASMTVTEKDTSQASRSPCWYACKPAM